MANELVSVIFVLATWILYIPWRRLSSEGILLLPASHPNLRARLCSHGVPVVVYTVQTGQVSFITYVYGTPDTCYNESLSRRKLPNLARNSCQRMPEHFCMFSCVVAGCRSCDRRDTWCESLDTSTYCIVIRLGS